MNAHATPPSLRQLFLDGMSRAAATVSVVATDGPAGRAGVTVSAMSSVSADGEAPTLLVCVHHLSPAATTIIANGAFCVNVLREDQSAISDTFAGRLPAAGDDKFACAEWLAMPSGAPRLAAPLAAFDCRVRSAERVGTHHVFLGAVADIFVAGPGNPLIFANRAYGAPARTLPTSTGEARTRERIRIGALPSFGPYLLPPVIAELEAARGPVSLDLHEADQRRLVELLRTGAIDLAILHDAGLGDDFAAEPVAALCPYVLLPAAHPLAGRERVALADLLPERLVLLDAAPNRDYVLSLFAGIGTPAIGFRAQSVEMVRGLVAHGLGYALLAAKPASPMSCDGLALATRPLASPVPPSRLVLARRRDATMNAATEAFLWHCTVTLTFARGRKPIGRRDVEFSLHGWYIAQ